MKYIYLEKPDYNTETETISPDYRIEDGTFITDWKVEPKPDEDGFVPEPEEQPDAAPTLRERVEIMEDAFAELCKEVFGNG